jgi:hypothetical protein
MLPFLFDAVRKVLHEVNGKQRHRGQFGEDKLIQEEARMASAVQLKTIHRVDVKVMGGVCRVAVQNVRDDA